MVGDADIPSPAASRPCGLKYLKKVLPMLAGLRDEGCERDRAGNRTFFYDQYVSLVLLYLFDPSLESMRAVCRSTRLKNVQRKVGCTPVSKSSFSEAARVFDPQLLLPVIEELGGRLKPLTGAGGTPGGDPRLADCRELADRKLAITCADGTLLKALPRITEAMWLHTQDGKPHHAWRLHAQFELDRYVPTRFDLTDAKNSGKSDEKSVLRKNLAPGRLYLLDRWYAQFTLLNDIRKAGSSYVCRAREPGEMNVLDERLLSDDALAAGVVRDAVVEMGTGMTGKKAARRPDHPVRLVVLEVTPHAKRGGQKGKRAGPPNTGLLYLVTDLLDVPAEIIALLYLYRYTIELFFRFFKHVLGCRHLLSDVPNGVAIQSYCAIIACMLISLWTGAKPSRATMEMLHWNYTGMATDRELEDHIRGLKKENA